MTMQFPSKKRAALFKLVCLSLFTSSTIGFATSSSSVLRQQPSISILSPALSSKQRAWTLLQMTPSSSSPERLSPEEENELLRQAVELRRLVALQENCMDDDTSILAMQAGYGTSINEYELAIAEGQRARQLLVTRNMGLVHYCLTQVVGKRRKLNSLSRDDLVQEGAIGLAKAVDKWNPEVGGKFSTYAVYWIRATIMRGIETRDDLLRVPSHVTQAIKTLEKAVKRLGLDQENWRDHLTLLSQETGLSEKNLLQAIKVKSRRHQGGYVAFESWMQKGATELAGNAAILEEVSAISSIETEQLRSTLAKYLRPREMEALSWRYGLTEEETPQAKASRYLAEAEQELFPVTRRQEQPQEVVKKGRFGEAMTFNEVGKKMQVSAEYGRKLCHAALAKLKQAADEGHLEPALLF